MFWINIDIAHLLNLIRLELRKDKLILLDGATITENNVLILPLFIKELSFQHERNAPIIVNSHVLDIIRTKTCLLFLKDQNDSNICFATDNIDLRDEFKIGFTTAELLHYCYGRHQLNIVAYPENAEQFWEYVHMGEKLAKLTI